MDSQIIVEERLFIKGSRDFKFHKELPKIMVLVSFQLSLPVTPLPDKAEFMCIVPIPGSVHWHTVQNDTKFNCAS